MTELYIAGNIDLPMYFGDLKNLSNIKKGDILISDENKPSIVMDIKTVKCPLYSITTDISTILVGIDHTLNLYSDYGGIVDISTADLMKKSQNIRDKFKLVSKSIEFASNKVKNDPYLVGILLGSKLSNIDDVIKQYLNKRLENLGNYISGIDDIKTLKMQTIDSEEIAHLLNHKYIPDEYLYNSRDVRHKLLKGFIGNNKRASRSKSLPRAPIPKLFNSTRRSATPKNVKKSNRVDRVDRIERGRQSVFKSRIPVLKDKNIKITIPSTILLEQMKFLIRSLGFRCIVDADELMILENVDKLKPLESVNYYSFKIKPSNLTECYLLNTTKILDCNGLII